MRVLVAVWAWPTHFYPLVPLSSALRAAGHEVLVASQPALLPAIRRSGLPGAVVGPDVAGPSAIADTVRTAGGTSRPRLSLSVRMAEVMLDGLIELGRRFRPDVILYEPTSYAGPLAAAVLGVPAVRHLWGIDIHRAARAHEPAAFAGLAAAYGVAGFRPQGLATVDPCPASIQVGSDGIRIAQRFIPFNGSGPMPRWLAEPPRRRRVCVSWGVAQSHRTAPEHATRLRALTTGLLPLLDLGVDLIVTVAPADRAALTGLPTRVRLATMIPLSLVTPSCDLLISRGGNGTLMTAMVSGTPQLLVVSQYTEEQSAQALAQAGAGRMLHESQVSPAEVAEHAAALLDSDDTRKRAAELSRESCARPAPARVAAELEHLIGSGVR
ncbi:MAG TPA: nucleotide disphospho-sugar-binding domain-containing protein [Streptosporangiaceae bacterium]|jgi:UDP:flavonoid glycosyltransferase YjiC (YdhE family)|nr:nucleotide disphospho-sugar-binding domain-containing protein [Streptosporangiaceae bacterium]